MNKFWFHMQEEIYRYIQLCILYMYSYYIFYVGFFFWCFVFYFCKKKCKFLIQADKNIAVYVWLANINYFYKKALRSNIVTVCFVTTHFQKISHFEKNKSIQRTFKKKHLKVRWHFPERSYGMSSPSINDCFAAHNILCVYCVWKSRDVLNTLPSSSLVGLGGGGVELW